MNISDDVVSRPQILRNGFPKSLTQALILFDAYASDVVCIQAKKAVVARADNILVEARYIFRIIYASITNNYCLID